MSDGDGQNKKSDRELVKNLLVGLAAAAIGFAFGLINDIRKARLDFVNAQIEKLYGPLNAFKEANDQTWNAFQLVHWQRPGIPGETKYFFDDRYPPTPDQVRRWRNWMKVVFQPQNEKMEEIIISNSHLLIGNEMPRVFERLMAHTEAYKAVMATWNEDELTRCEKGDKLSAPNCMATQAIRNTAVGLNHPARTLSDCIAGDYITLKKYQQRLLYSLFEVLIPTRLVRSPRCDQEPP